MASRKIEDVNLELDELKTILPLLSRRKNVDYISLQIKRLETELTNLRQEQSKSESVELNSVPKVANQTKRYEFTLTNYAWDQSDKFIKVFVTLDGLKDVPQSNAIAEFTTNSVFLRINNVQNKDYTFNVNNLLHAINTESSYHKVKSNCVVLYMKKAEEAKHWSHLTITEKRVDDVKKAGLEADSGSKDDPGAGLMKIMQKMYESGDSETKRMIAKAWTEGQEKSLKPGVGEL